MWWMGMAMIRCHRYLTEVSRDRGERYSIIMQVHDEMVFDFPRGRGKEPQFDNLSIIQECMSLMRAGGDDIGLPTPVSCKYHPESWAVGISI